MSEKQSSLTTGVTAYAVVTLISGTTSILVARSLSAQLYGDYASTYAKVVAIPNLLGLGLNYLLMRQAQRSDINVVYKAAVLITSGLTACLGLIFVFTLNWSPYVVISIFFVTQSSLLVALASHIPKPNVLVFSQVMSSMAGLVSIMSFIVLGKLNAHVVVLASSLSSCLGPWYVVKRYWGLNLGTSDFQLTFRRTLKTVVPALNLQVTQVPIPTFLALLPLIASWHFSSEEVAYLGIGLTYGAVVLALGNFLSTAVYVPNLIKSRQVTDDKNSFLHHVIRQSFVIATCGGLFLVLTYFQGAKLIPIIVGESFAGGENVTIAASGIYVAAVFYAVFSNAFLVIAKMRYLAAVQGTTLVLLAVSTYLTFTRSTSIQGWLLLIAAVFSITTPGMLIVLRKVTSNRHMQLHRTTHGDARGER